MSVTRKDDESSQSPVFFERYRRGAIWMLRKYFGPESVWTSLSHTAMPTPPWKGPYFFSGWRGAAACRFVFVDMGALSQVSGAVMYKDRIRCVPTTTGGKERSMTHIDLLRNPV